MKLPLTPHRKVARFILFLFSLQCIAALFYMQSSSFAFLIGFLCFAIPVISYQFFEKRYYALGASLLAFTASLTCIYFNAGWEVMLFGLSNIIAIYCLMKEMTYNEFAAMQKSKRKETVAERPTANTVSVTWEVNSNENLSYDE